MATQEEIYKIILQFENEEKLKTVSASAALAEQKFKALYDQLGAGNQKTKAAAAALSDLNGQVKKAGSALRQMNSGGATQAMTQLGYAVDDAQYGFKGLANNIQPVLSTIPKLARFAPYIAIAATAANLLYEHWDQLKGALGTGTTKTEAQEMEELRDKTEKTADETERLLKYERSRKSLATQNQQTARQVETTDSISEALREVTPKRVDAAVDAIHGDRIRNSVSDEATQAARRAKRKRDDAQGRLDELNRKEPGEVTQHEFGQARKDRDRAQANFNKTLEAFNKEYGEKREKFKAGLATDVNSRGEAEKLEKFLAEAEKTGALSRKEIEAIRDSTPAARERKADEIRDHKDRMDIDSRKAEADRQYRLEQIQENSAGLTERFSPAILNNVARGHANDPAALAAKISEQLQSNGKTKEEAEDIAPQIADDLLTKIGLRVKERANQQGLSKEEAAAREAEDDTAAARARAPKPKSHIGDLAGFAQNLQQALFDKGDPVQAAILAVNRQQADKLDKIIEETRKVIPRQPPVAVAAGPG